MNVVFSRLGIFSASHPGRFWRRLNASQLFGGSFLLLIAFGTLGLKIIPGLYTGDPLSWLDAFFTATSAVCVTGLIVVDTATYFTTGGQAFLLFLIQLGGLGMIAFSTVIILAIGRRMSLRHEKLAITAGDVAPEIDSLQLARHVVSFTLLFELTGALLLFALWQPRMGTAEAFWAAIFHAISAFCNAGFSTFSDSLVGFQSSPGSLAVIMALIIVGGIGFLTMEELYLRSRPYLPRRAGRLSLHSRIVLSATAILIVGGWLVFTLLEWRLTLAGLPPIDRVVNGLFLSVTTRTAGFNTVDYEQASSASNFLTILLMSVGGSPGSTAGGLKTTTFAVIGLLAWSRLRGNPVVSFQHRSIPEEIVQRAVGLFVVAFGIVTIAIFLLTVTELGRGAAANAGDAFLLHMFEAASAFNTVGLSMGATGDLSIAGKWIVTILMFLGRIGPLTFASAIALPADSNARSFRYAYEEVIIG